MYYKKIVRLTASLLFFVFLFMHGNITGQNYGLKFLSNSDMVKFSREDIDGAWTVEFWVLKTNALSYSTAIDGNTGKIMLESWSHNHQVGITKKGVADWAFNYVVPVNQWTHLAFVCDGSKTELYVNGNFQDEMNNTIPMPIYALGRAPESPRMIIDEIRFWTLARTGEQIAEYYNKSVDINSEGLTGYYYLDDQAPAPTDISPSHINGEILGPVYALNTNPDFTTTLPDMTFSSLTVENENEYFSKPGSTDQDILKINITTEGVLNALTLNNISVTLSGTDALSDISGVKLYFTSYKGVFDNESPVDTTKQPATGEIVFSGNVVLNPGNNYFWLAYDVADNAIIENKLDGTLSYVTVDNETINPSVPSPAGFRVIRDGIPQMPAIRNAVIPKPHSMVLDTTHHFILTPTTKIVVTDSTLSEGNKLSAFLQKATGYPFEVSLTAPPTGNISLSITGTYNNEIGEEGYLLTCDQSGIQIEANTTQGIFYGWQTLRQLLPAAIESQVVVPNTTWDVAYVNIVDFPRFSWRGLHLDVSRHFFDVDFIKKYIDIMAINKLNRFHWHLTDDQGWRIEILSKPLLQSISAWRTCNGVTYGGYYTQAEITDIVNYAAERHVMVIPEIEMPGHTVEVLAAYPELSCATASAPHGGPFTVRCNWGTPPDIFCAGKEETFEFLEDVLTEVCDLFPAPYIHLGGDEAIKTRWEQCPDCQARMQQEGLANEEELQRYFMERIGNFLITKNKKWIGWSEITYGGVPDSATVMSWLGESSAITAAQQGHDAILSPYSVLYLDAPNSDDPNEPPSIGYAPNTLEKIYFYDPMPASLTQQQQQYILGPHSCLWTEYISETDHAEYMILPRIFALSEIGWYGNGNNFGEFRDRVYPKFQRLDLLGYNYRPLDFPGDLLPGEIMSCDDSVVLKVDIAANSFYWNTPGNPTVNTIVANTSGIYKCYVDYLGEINTVKTTVTLKEPITQPEVTVSGTEWTASGNADLYLWYNADDSIVYEGDTFTPPGGANPYEYSIAGMNLISKKSSVRITGGNDYAKTENSDFLNNTDAFAIMGWLNIHQYDIWDQLFTKRLNLANRISVELADGRFYFEIGNGSNTYGYSENVVSENQWHHYAFVYNGSGNGNNEKLRIYVDGIQLPLSFNGTIPSTTASDTIPFTIGSPVANPEFDFTEVSLWERALTSVDIARMKNKQLAGDEEGLVYYFKTGGEDDTLVNFATNYNYNATIINFGNYNRMNNYNSVSLYGCESEKWNIGEIATGVSEKTSPFPLSVIPNPNNGNFTVSFTLPSKGNAVLKIFDVKGNMIYSKHFYGVSKVTHSPHTGYLPGGSYILSVETDHYKQKKIFVIR
jgi:N-acetyl-beta-hexosaminidase